MSEKKEQCDILLSLLRLTYNYAQQSTCCLPLNSSNQTNEKKEQINNQTDRQTDTRAHTQTHARKRFAAVEEHDDNNIITVHFP